MRKVNYPTDLLLVRASTQSEFFICEYALIYLNEETRQEIKECLSILPSPNKLPRLMSINLYIYVSFCQKLPQQGA